MKKTLLILFVFLTYNFSALAQDEVKSFVQQKAYPKEGLQVFMKEFVNKFDYKNADKIPNDVTEIKLRVKFIVEKDGTFNDIKLIDDTYNFKNEVIRILNEMPVWNAAMHEGKNVRSAFTLPITIRITPSEVTSPDEIVFKTPDEINTFKASLKSNKVDTDYFDLTCNCTLARSSKNDELKSEEFYMPSQDQTASYNVAFRKLSSQQAKEEIETIKSDAVKQNSVVKKVSFNGIEATELHVNVPNGDYVNVYRMLFFYHNEHVIAVSVVTYKKQIADLLFEHLKQNFKLKI
ncbi:hypothetical protein [Paenimyroides viscosum]|uniref:TonB C-terminal domain-containing protein n=1 Tax=Paenimyroides viscosum TaxID=2488729 RepID=A0A3P1B6M8_9FLAO|nr:hypothetical protein [Paenimyroides viscosum]RRA96698.1 hypothetical protein EG242_01270 [Paenimyroides viscosum]